MLVSSSVSGSAFYALMTRWVTLDPDLYYWYTQEDNTVTVTINDTSVEVVVRVETESATYNINVYCTSVIDLGEYVREAAHGGTVTVTFLEDGEEAGQWVGDALYGFYPLEVVTPPPFLPYHDEDDSIRIPMVATTEEGCMVAETTDGASAWQAGDNMETEVTLSGGESIRWGAVGCDCWRYSQALKIPNECETINLQWYSRNGLVKRWVFEVASVTTEVADPVEIITNRGIGLRRIGAPSRTVTVRTPGCNIHTRKWLSDLAISPVTYAYRRYVDSEGETQRQLIRVTCESIEVDLSEKMADFEATINIEKGRAS